MQYKSVKGFTGWGQLGFLFAFLGLGFILAGGAELLLTLKILPAGVKMTDKDAVMNAMFAPENVTMLRIIQVVGTLLLLFVPSVLWSFVSNGKKMFWLGFSKYVNWQQLLLGFLIIFIAAFVAGPLEDLSKYIIGHFPALDTAAKKLEDEYTQQALALSNLRGWGDYITGLIIMAFFPAMFEEVFFRGVVQNLLVKWIKKPIVGITLASLIFSLIHMSIYMFLSRFVLGFVLGLMFYETKNIWVNIIAHFLNNTIVLSQLFFATKFAAKAVNKNDMADPHIPWYLSIVGLSVLTGLFILLQKFSLMNRSRVEAKERLLIAEADPFRSFTETEINSGGHQ